MSNFIFLYSKHTDYTDYNSTMAKKSYTFKIVLVSVISNWVTKLHLRLCLNLEIM